MGIFNGEVIADKMQNAEASVDYKSERRVIWRKVSRSKGIYRTEEQIQIDEEEKNAPKKEETTDEKLKALSKTFDWQTYNVENEQFVCEFPDDDEKQYTDADKYPNEEYGWTFVPSSKTKMVLQKIQSIRKSKPNDKIIIFSQFTSMLKVMQRVLRKYDIGYLTYDGSKNRQQRKEIIAQFKEDKDDNDIPVILMSLKTAALGLNLTVANHVIFCDLWWNPATEAQAVDRVHRIGQTKHVYITRIVIKASVEERMLELQREKKKIADSALDGANFAKKNKLSVGDLGRLFGADQSVIDMAEGRVGFTRDQLMNRRERHSHNHNHSHPQRNVPAQPVAGAPAPQRSQFSEAYVNSLDSATRAMLRQMGAIP